VVDTSNNWQITAFRIKVKTAVVHCGRALLPHHRSVSANELRWLHARRCFCAAKHYARQFDSAVFFVQSLSAKKYICKRASVVPNSRASELWVSTEPSRAHKRVRPSSSGFNFNENPSANLARANIKFVCLCLVGRFVKYRLFCMQPAGQRRRFRPAADGQLYLKDFARSAALSPVACQRQR